jgi:hypothetical protein
MDRGKSIPGQKIKSGREKRRGRKSPARIELILLILYILMEVNA